MSSREPSYTADEFGREAAYIDRLIWEALVVEPDTDVLFCGYGPEGTWVRRAIEAGAKVTVIEHRNDYINRFAHLDARLLRGSTSVIPARDHSFDLAVSFHYLHEIDPFFHAQVVSELARVARRVAVVEPSPPGDPLGKQIAILYSQAKRELGQFEYYQPIEYWKKLLQGALTEVSQYVFAFAKVPPREYLFDTVELLLRTMEVEDAPQAYLTELRAIAERSDASLLPPPRFVLVGAAAGDLVPPRFSQRPQPKEPVRPAVAPKVPTPITSAAVPIERQVSAESGYEFPPVDAPARATGAAPAARPAPPPPVGFGPGPLEAPAAPAGSPFGSPFALPDVAAPEASFGIGGAGAQPPGSWEWEPPDGGDGGEEPKGFGSA